MTTPRKKKLMPFWISWPKSNRTLIRYWRKRRNLWGGKKRKKSKRPEEVPWAPSREALAIVVPMGPSLKSTKTAALSITIEICIKVLRISQLWISGRWWNSIWKWRSISCRMPPSLMPWPKSINSLCKIWEKSSQSIWLKRLSLSEATPQTSLLTFLMLIHIQMIKAVSVMNATPFLKISMTITRTPDWWKTWGKAWRICSTSVKKTPKALRLLTLTFGS